MNRFNFNIRDRKLLYGVLCVVLVCVFTLTVAYAALSVSLNISGSAEVVASDWDVHLDNVKVTSGSVSGPEPTITNAVSASFSTTLTTPGDFYEFSIDVVNNGSIDAMIESINKTPTLTAAQAKYLKYEITYQNGEAITTKQLVEKDSFVRLMVRVEFRNDISASDLPSSAETLNLSFTVNYVQSDGSGSSITGNGVAVSNAKFAVGDEFCFGEECFYVLKDDGTTVTAITKYNLEVGGILEGPFMYGYIENPSGIQSKLTLISETPTSGYVTQVPEWYAYGTVEFTYNDFSADSYPADIYSDQAVISEYVNDYVDYVVGLGANVINSRLITLGELNNLGCTADSCENAPDFLKDLIYWTGTASSSSGIYYVENDVLYSEGDFTDDYLAGVRPVLEFETSGF